MRLIRNLFFLVAALFIFENINISEAKAASCTLTSGVYSATEVTRGSCEATPDAYDITIYEMYLCTSLPTAPTTTTAADLDAGGCVQVFNNASGSSASVTQNSAVNLSGTFTRPPNNTYTHGFAKMENTFGITASIELDGNVTGQTGGTGTFCGTVSGSGTTGSNSSLTASTICSTSAVTAAKHNVTMTSFNSSSFVSSATANNINGTDASITGYLVDTNGYLSADDDDTDKLHGTVVFASSITFTDSITSVKMSFNVGSGMTLYPDNSGDLVMDSGPFQAIMTVE